MLITGFREIATMADRINLPKSVVDRANLLFKQFHDGGNVKGRAKDVIASACLYFACRQEGVPRTFKVSTCDLLYGNKKNSCRRPIEN